MNRLRPIRVTAAVCMAALAGAAPGRAADDSTDATGLWVSAGAVLAAVAAMVLVSKSDEDSTPAAAPAAPQRRFFSCDPDPAEGPAGNCVEVPPAPAGAAAAFAAPPPRPGDPRLTLRPKARPGAAGLLARYRFSDDRDASIGLAAGRGGEAALVLRYSLRW